MRAPGRERRTGPLLLTACVAVAALPGMLAAQDTVVVRAGEQYEAGALERFFLGDGYRALWLAPFRAPVLDLDRVAGGLSVIERGGGHMTRTLHLQGADGRRFVFRTMDKYVEQALPAELQRTFVHDLVQDQISALLPTGALIVPRLAKAAGVLHVSPVVYVLPDDARLAEHRATFAGVLGMLEESPNEGEDGKPGFAGSNRVVGTERLLERIEEDPAQRVAAREYLAARLLDFVIGDTDRGSDQWRWAGMPVDGGGLLFRPIPRDRDFAFHRADGRLAAIARRVYPKFVRFGPELPSMRALLISSLHRDRRFLSTLSRADWDAVTAGLQAALTDDVIAAAVAKLPPPHAALAAAEVQAGLRARRDALADAAGRFYEQLATHVDLHATSSADTAAIEVRADGSVEVTFAAAGGHAPLQRRFLPAETREVRIHLLDGDDHAVVRGGGTTPIRLRIIGGGGDDELVDLTTSGNAAVAFYDDEGVNDLRGSGRTRIDTRPFREPPADSAWAARRVTRGGYRDHGRSTAIRPLLDIDRGGGLVVGASRVTTVRGFRRVPFARRITLAARYALGSPDALIDPGARGFGIDARAERTWENSPWLAAIVVAGEQFDSFRFSGFGNDTPLPARRPGDRHGLVLQDRLALQPSLAWAPGGTERVTVGLRARWFGPRPVAGSPLARSAPYGSSAFGDVGAWLRTRVGSGAWRWRTAAFLTPGLWDAPAASGGIETDARAQFLLGAAPDLTLRGGAARVWGAFPVQDAAVLGGRSTLRGFRSHRFTGDAAVWGGAELHSHLTRARFLIRGDLGAFLFADAGRVYVAGASPGGVHTGYGAGLSFSSLGFAVRGSWARGEDDRVYIELGSNR